MENDFCIVVNRVDLLDPNGCHGDQQQDDQTKPNA
jgi:hypothetical protein